MFTAALQKYSSMKLIKTRAKVPNYCFDFTTWLGKNSKMKVLRVHSDNAKEFLGIKSELMKKRIELTTSTPYNSESNGLAEINE